MEVRGGRCSPRQTSRPGARWQDGQGWRGPGAARLWKSRPAETASPPHAVVQPLAQAGSQFARHIGLNGSMLSPLRDGRCILSDAYVRDVFRAASHDARTSSPATLPLDQRVASSQGHATTVCHRSVLQDSRAVISVAGCASARRLLHSAIGLSVSVGAVTTGEAPRPRIERS